MTELMRWFAHHRALVTAAPGTVKSTATSTAASASASRSAVIPTTGASPPEPAAIRPTPPGSTAATSSMSAADCTAAHTVAPMRPAAPITPTLSTERE